jgi:choline-sulfatase
MHPNLLILCPDELRADCLGFMGNSDMRTPRMDALARASVIFPQHVASFPKCLPARISLMTGRYSHADGYRTIFQRMRPGTPNLLSRVRDAGYETALFGKNHCWDRAERRALFDHCSKEPPYAAEMAGVPAIRQSAPKDGGVKPLELSPGYDYIGCNTRHAGDEFFTKHTCEFLQERRDFAKPFFMQVNLESPHPYYGVEEPWYSMYDREKISAWPHALPKRAPKILHHQREVRTSTDTDEAALREIQAVYYGMISKVDEQIGAILDALRASGEWENTVIVFLSDHGDYAGQYGLAEKWDTSFADCVVRTPLTICAPGLAGGKEVDSLSDHTNLAPTLLELLGLPPLPDTHGQSLLPVIAGERRIDVAFSEGGHEASMRARFEPAKSSPAIARDPSQPIGEKQEVYLRFPDTMARGVMARSANAKVVLREDGDNEFYDLIEDPWELNNRWGDEEVQGACSQLVLALAEWQLKTGYEGPREEFFGA